MSACFLASKCMGVGGQRACACAFLQAALWCVWWVWGRRGFVRCSWASGSRGVATLVEHCCRGDQGLGYNAPGGADEHS